MHLHPICPKKERENGHFETRESGRWPGIRISDPCYVWKWVDVDENIYLKLIVENGPLKIHIGF